MTSTSNALFRIACLAHACCICRQASDNRCTVLSGVHLLLFQVHAELILEVPVEHGLLLENLLDLAHAPFTHTSTFAKGWPVPDVVKFNAARMLGGNWEPYPIDMAFEPPCMVLSTIGASPNLC